MVKVKKKKRVKQKAVRTMFSSGGLDLLVMGGVIGLFYQTLYLLITVEAQTAEVSYYLFWRLFQEMGILFLFLGIVLVSYSFLKEEESMKKFGGSSLISGALLSLPVVVYSTYKAVTGLEGQTVTLKSFLTTTAPNIVGNFSKVYIFAGVLFLGIFFWGHRRARTAAAAFFVGGAILGCIFMVIWGYNTYETSKAFLEMYPDSRDLIFAQFLFPDVLNIIYRLLLTIGVLTYTVYYLSKYNLKRWTGRIWFFGGAVGFFHWLLRFRLDSTAVHREVVGVRQAIMQLTPYSTSLKDQALTIETMKEFYMKKMIPTYVEPSVYAIICAGIAAIALYLWTRE